MPTIERIQVETSLAITPGSYILALAVTPDGQENPALSRHVLTRASSAYSFSILFCQHCQTPTCIAACPSRAMYVDPNGVLMLVDDDCLRCGGCEASCPHHAIFSRRPPDQVLSCALSQESPCTELHPLESLTLRLELRPH